MQSRAEIDARLARYAMTKDARDLWPEVSSSAFRAAQKEIARVTAAALAGAWGPIELRLPPATDARVLGIAASAAGMGPLLGLWCETERIATEPPVAALLATHLDHGRRRASRMRHELERLLVPLADRDIEVVVLKGTHTGHRYFPEPGSRPSTDIDLLVSPEQEPAARGVLGDLGFAQVSPGELQGTVWTPSGDGAVRSLELAHAENPWSVDLHLSLDRRLFASLTTGLGTPSPSEGEVWNEFARPVRVLPQPLLLAYLALHASGHFYSITLIRLVEIVLVARRDFGQRSELWDAFDALVRRTGTGRFVFPALDLAERLAPGSIDPGVLERVAGAAPRLLRRMVRDTTPAWAQRLHPYPTGERLVWVGSPREVMAALADTAWPRLDGKLLSPHKALGVHWYRIRRGIARMMRG
ncbi:MAG TPA: nucleotidyltransferase family protein [Gemmatimonadales bacterium]|jgi:hypothetical protein